MTAPFTCPHCQLASHHPRDAEERYCRDCGFVDDRCIKFTCVDCGSFVFAFGPDAASSRPRCMTCSWLARIEHPHDRAKLRQVLRAFAPARRPHD